MNPRSQHRPEQHTPPERSGPDAPRPTRRAALRTAAALAAASALTLTAAACGSDGDGGAAKGDPKAPFYKLLPKEYQDAGKLTVGTNAAYAPNEFYSEKDRKTIVGLDPDLGAAIGKQLGIEFAFVNNDFEALITALRAKRIDLIMSSMTDTPERQKSIDFVNYFNVGTSILVAKGNPENIQSLDDLCGKTIALQKATTQEEVAREQQAKCKTAGEPLTVLALKNDTDALVQVRQGRAVADMNDYPVAQYNADKSGGDFEVVGTQIEAGLYGIGVAKDDPKLRDAVKAALDAIIENGEYDRIVAKWKLEKGKVDQATINGGQ